MINIKDFCDMEQFEQIMSNWAKATGLATALQVLMADTFPSVIIFGILY